MNTNELFEKLYFYELEQKEKIAARLQLPLAMLIALVGFIGFMLNSVRSVPVGLTVGLFWTAIIGAMVVVCFGAYQFARALWGNTYKCLPTAAESDAYLSRLYETYKEYEGGKEIAQEHFQDYIASYLRDCSSENSQVNDARALRIHNTFSYLIIATFLSVIAFSTFYIGSLNKNYIQTPPAKENSR